MWDTWGSLIEKPLVQGIWDRILVRDIWDNWIHFVVVLVPRRSILFVSILEFPFAATIAWLDRKRHFPILVPLETLFQLIDPLVQTTLKQLAVVWRFRLVRLVVRHQKVFDS